MNAWLRGSTLAAVSFSIFSFTDSRGAAETVVKPAGANEYPGGNPWNKPEGNTLWKIEIRRQASGIHAAALRQIHGLVVHQSGEQAMVLARYPDHCVEYWSDGPHAVVSVAGSADVVEYVAPKRVSPAGRAQPPPPVSGAGFDFGGLARMLEWEWVKPEHYRGRIRVDGVVMLVFCEVDPEDTAAHSLPPSGPQPEASGAIQFPVDGALRAALVEERTRTPRVLQIGDEFWDYSFHGGQKPSFVFPEKVRRFLASMAPFYAGRTPLP